MHMLLVHIGSIDLMDKHVKETQSLQFPTQNMVVRIRLQRFGRKHLPFYRIVVADSRSPRDGKFIEKIGTYNPIPSKDGVKELAANSDRVHYWMTCGAQPSDRVAWLFGQIGLLPPPPVREKTKSLLPKAVLKAQK